MPYDMEPEGAYYARPVSGVASETSKSTPQIVVQMSITHKADETSESGWAQMTVPILRDVYLYLSTAAYEYTREHLETLGFNGDYTTPEFSCEGCTIVCKHETFDGRTREKWSLGGGGPKPLKESQRDVLQARWANEHPEPVSTGAPPPAPVAAGVAPAATAPPTDDDIPF